MTCSPGLDASPSTETSPAPNPKRLRYCLLHAAGQIARTGRRTRLRLASGWPWATDLVAAFDRVRIPGLQT